VSAVLAADQVERYLAAVEAALADLPAAERMDLLDDVRQHLAEVAAETDGPLETALGPSSSYAAELRSAAGLTRPPAARGDTRWQALRRHRVARELAAFLVSLRPGWWVLRGALLAAAAVLPSRTDTVILSPYGGDVLALLLAVLAGVVVSALVGRALLDAPGPVRLLAVAANVVALLFVANAYAEVQYRVSDLNRRAGATPPPAAPSSPVPGSLIGPDGVVDNITPYDALGRLLTGVQLFDQDGRPLRLQVGQDPAGRPLTRQVPVGADGSTLDNVFPQTQTVDGSTAVPAPPATVAALPTAAVAVVPPGLDAPQPLVIPLPVAAPSPAPTTPAPTTPVPTTPVPTSPTARPTGAAPGSGSARP